MKALILVGFLLCSPLSGYAQQYADVIQRERDEDVEQILNAQRWVEAFNKLDKRRNITVVLAHFNSVIELEHIIEAKSEGRFLILRYKHKNGGTYHYLVYPTSILLIKETPLHSGA